MTYSCIDCDVDCRKFKREYVDIDLFFPKTSTLEESFLSILDLHCNDGEKEVEEREKNYFSSLDYQLTLFHCI